MVYEPNLATGLLCTHNIITRALDVSLEHCGKSLSSGELDEASKKGFIDYLQCIKTVITAHHHLETQKMFPYFRDKISDLPVDKLNKEHGQIGMQLMKFDDIFPGLTGGSLISSLKQLNETLNVINNIWHPHIEVEEEYLTAEKISALVDEDEMMKLIKEYRKFSMERYTPDYLVIPFQYYNLPRNEREIWARELPETTQKLLHTEWKDKWLQMADFLFP